MDREPHPGTPEPPGSARLNQIIEEWQAHWQASISAWIAHQGYSDVADAVQQVPALLGLLMDLIRDSALPLPLREELARLAQYVFEAEDDLPEAEYGAAGLVDDAVAVADGLVALLDAENDLNPALLREHWTGPDDPVMTIRLIHANRDSLLSGKDSP
ncbi:MAG: hypothetical protein HC915_06925 [Anaerolineae bacterium]|nr:hypothetical protein [Anaerolineae bacterium]